MSRRCRPKDRCFMVKLLGYFSLFPLNKEGNLNRPRVEKEHLMLLATKSKSVHSRLWIGHGRRQSRARLRPTPREQQAKVKSSLMAQSWGKSSARRYSPPSFWKTELL